MNMKKSEYFSNFYIFIDLGFDCVLIVWGFIDLNSKFCLARCRRIQSCREQMRTRETGVGQMWLDHIVADAAFPTARCRRR
jgi:hypothetical protein